MFRGPQRIPWIHFCNGYFEFEVFFNWNNRGTDVRSNWRCVYLEWPLEYLTKKPPAPTKQAIISSIQAKTCSALLLTLPVCISVYLKSVPRHTFFILDTYHPDTLYLCEQGCEDPWLFCEAKRGSESKNVLGNAALTGRCLNGDVLCPVCGTSRILLLTLQRGVTGTARMLHALTHSSISRQVREQM